MNLLCYLLTVRRFHVCRLARLIDKWSRGTLGTSPFIARLRVFISHIMNVFYKEWRISVFKLFTGAKQSFISVKAFISKACWSRRTMLPGTKITVFVLLASFIVFHHADAWRRRRRRRCTPRGCEVSSWSSWSRCSADQCGQQGSQHRTRTVTSHASCGEQNAQS